jgi:hypothetical protein
MLLLRGLSRIAKGKDQETMLDAAVREFSDISRWMALDRLLKRAWWQRTWVVQECAVARDISVICGYRDISWMDLINAVMLIGQLMKKKVMWQCIGRVDTSAVIALHKSRLRVAARGDQGIQSTMPRMKFDSLLEVLSRYRSRQATDPRDKVYALLHLAQDFRDAAYTASTKPIPVDYARSVENVYEDVAEFLVSTHHLDFLSYCRPKRHLAGLLPSWIPDWSDTSEKPYPLTGSYSTTGNSSAEAHIDGPRLIVKGLQFDGIKTLGDACKDTDFSRLSPSPTFCQWKALALHSCPHPLCEPDGVRQHQEDDFMRILISNRIRNNWLDDTTLPSCREAYRIWDSRTSDLEDTETLGARFGDLFETADFIHALQLTTLGRRFFISDKGVMGLAPEETVEGDVLVAFLGVQLPFILRKKGEDEHMVIGEW